MPTHSCHGVKIKEWETLTLMGSRGKSHGTTENAAYRLVQVFFNDRHLFPGQGPHRSSSQTENFLDTHVFHEPLRRPGLTVFFFFFCGMVFRQLRSSGNVGFLRPYIFGEKKKSNPPPGVRLRDGRVEDVCKMSGSIS